MRWIVTALLFALASTASAQTAISPQINMRADTLLAVLRDGKADAADFATAFLAQVPPEQLVTIARQLRETNGAVKALGSITPEGENQATIAVEYERATVSTRIALDPVAPYRFIGLLVTGVTRNGDNFAAIEADLVKLPGTKALLVAKLGDVPPQPLIAVAPDTPLATGSVFKLFVLDNLVGQIAAKSRKWTDVVPLGPPSLPSGVTQDWPRGTPMTLQTLATQMISISDNTAADTLIETLGRPKIDATRARFGITPQALPVLTTLDAFALKMPASARLRDRWIAGGLGERRQVLNELEPTVENIDRTQLAGPPLYIDRIEWPATMSEVVAVLDDLRRSASPQALGILAVNPALGPNQRAQLAYAGYKGGSETGVVALAWLLKTKSGDWYAVTAAWNNPAASVDSSAFAALISRAVSLVGK